MTAAFTRISRAVHDSLAKGCPSKVASAEVDPERKLALEANFTNNSRTSKPDNRAAAKWYVRWLFWLENLFFAAGFFS